MTKFSGQASLVIENNLPVRLWVCKNCYIFRFWRRIIWKVAIFWLLHCKQPYFCESLLGRKMIVAHLWLRRKGPMPPVTAVLTLFWKTQKFA